MSYIKRNAVQCLNCGDVIESRHRHDFVSCECGDVSIDGGRAYFRRAVKDGGAYEDLSEVVDDDGEGDSDE